MDLLHPKQMLLLGRANMTFLVRQVHRNRDEAAPIFVFGRTRGIGTYAPVHWLADDPTKFQDKALEWVTHQGHLEAWSRTYSTVEPLGHDQWSSISVCWPIEPELFQAAEGVVWDMTRSDAPIDWLQEVIDEISSHYPH